MTIPTILFVILVVYLLFFSKNNQGCGCLLILLVALGAITLT